MKSVIFDLNGVFIKSEYLTSRLEERYGIPEEESLTALKIIMNKVRYPNAPSIYSLWKPYFIKWGVDFNEDEFLKWYFSGEFLDEDMFNYAKSLTNKGIDIYYLSNNFMERTEFYRTELSELFIFPKKAYFSWETGLVKPDLEVYKQIIKDNSLDPKETFYLDDSEENLLAAKSLGINTMLITKKTTVEDIDLFIFQR